MMKIQVEGEMGVSEVKICGLQVGKTTTNLTISTRLSSTVLQFDGFEIFIDEDGLSFKRTVLRPNHDHDDQQELRLFKKEITPRWTADWKNSERFHLKFGPVKVDY
jgi:hypothetical protein